MPNVGIGTTSPANALDIGNGGGIHISSGIPTSTTNALYNNSGTLYFSGTAIGGGSYPAAASIMLDEGSAVTGTWGALFSNSQRMTQYEENTGTHANGDALQQHFFLASGAYTLSVLGISGANRAKVDWYIDGVSVVTGQDWYSASTTYNVVMTAAVTVTGNGDHILKAVVNGKNASSADYYFDVTKAWLK